MNYSWETFKSMQQKILLECAVRKKKKPKEIKEKYLSIYENTRNSRDFWGLKM